MKVLVEHVLYTPSTGAIHGGAEKSTYLAIEALRLRGHEVELVASRDSTTDCIKAPVWSGYHASQNGGVMRLKEWYAFIRELSTDYDAVLLNHPLTSQSVLHPQNAEWLSKSTYINRDATGWFVQGAGGMRLLTNARWLRYNGGRAYYMCERNRDRLDWVWKHPKKGPEVRNQCCAGGVARIGHTDFFATALFDGWHDNSICPPDLYQASESEGYLVSVGRPDRTKRLPEAAKLAKKMGKKHLVFTTSAPSDYTQECIQKLKDLGSTVILDAPHHEVMEGIAKSEMLLLSSKMESFCQVAFEAVAHGVPVVCAEQPSALNGYPQLAVEWGASKHTSLAERQVLQHAVKTTHTLDALGRRLEEKL